MKETQHLAALFKQKAEAVSAEVFIAPDFPGALSLALDWLRKEQKTKITADDRIAGLLAGQELSGLGLVFPDRPEKFAELQAALVEADFGVAETGTLVHLIATPHDQWRWTLPENCLAFLDRGKLAASMDNLLEVLNAYLSSGQVEGEGCPANEVKQISFVTGPSRTADIEGQLELGAHRPLRLLIFIYG